jgi:branched-chain amino acid transport system permease protein
VLAFTLAAVVASAAGILSVWYNRRISPGSIDLAQTIDVLIIAVIGGLYRLEGAFIGALLYALLDNYSRKWTPDVGNVLGPERFNTLLGVVFLIIVLLSPGGLVGLWERARDRLRAGSATTERRESVEGTQAAGD